MELILYTIYTFVLATIVSSACGWQIGSKTAEKQPLATTHDASVLAAFYVNTLYLHMSLFPSCFVAAIVSDTKKEFGILFVYCICSTLLLRATIIMIVKTIIHYRNQ